jgi:carboxynorspermidine decarboxylase
MSDTPAFVCEMAKLQENLKLLDDIQKRGGVKILLALKGFALSETFALMRNYLYGASASSLNEARLSYEKFAKETHTYLPAYKESEIEQISAMSDTLIFNSLSQFKRFYPEIKDKSSCGLRINLQMPFKLPDHCNANKKQSHLGILYSDIKELPKEIEGLHVHALCSQNANAFKEMLDKLESEFSSQFKELKWINFGGGHALTCKDYDREYLIKILQEFREKYPHLTLYLEPSEAIVHKAGYLQASVLDIVHNEIDIAILDISVEVHLTDVMITKKAPPLRQEVKDGKYSYKLAGCSCVAGDIFGVYNFKEPLNIGDRLIFENQLAYTIVKSTAFNGIASAKIVIDD